jgi:hypothetical protein
MARLEGIQGALKNQMCASMRRAESEDCYLGMLTLLALCHKG